MKIWAMFVVGVLCGVVVAVVAPKVAMHLHAAVLGGLEHGGTSSNVAEMRVHSKETFAFTANGAMEEVAPLFGADKERVWAPEWNPQFVYPVPVKDAEGMVFNVAHGHRRAVWVCTEYDLEKGRVQYVYVIPEALLTVITLKMKPAEKQTAVEVTYERTALSAEADEHVRHMAEGDRGLGPEWEKQVNGYLESRK
ncbi:MAG: hypothetical protein WCE52_04645 [Candidatus Acidiferrum sp.]